MILIENEREKEKSFQMRQIKSQQALKKVNQQRNKHKNNKLSTNLIKRIDIEDKLIELHQKDQLK